MECFPLEVYTAIAGAMRCYRQGPVLLCAIKSRGFPMVLFVIVALSGRIDNSMPFIHVGKKCDCVATALSRAPDWAVLKPAEARYIDLEVARTLSE